MKANRVKPVSKLRRYEYISKRMLQLHLDNGQAIFGPVSQNEIDAWVDEQIWREAHPGQEPEVDFGDVHAGSAIPSHEVGGYKE